MRHAPALERAAHDPKGIRSPAMDPRYPVGPFVTPAVIDSETRTLLVEEIAAAPAALRAAVDGLSPEQLDTPYREGGWTVRQVVHHLPDSHVNAYTRFKLALTEDNPTIRPYDEAAWARLADARDGDVELALAFYEAVQARWVAAIRATPDEAFARTFVHPETRRTMRLDQLLALYAWHGRHHVAHVTELRRRRGW